jgi:hypothetical protein
MSKITIGLTLLVTMLAIKVMYNVITDDDQFPAHQPVAAIYYFR